MSKSAGKAAVRCQALTEIGGLAAAESHGHREDASSQMRKISDDPPLVFGSLDLRPAYEAHMAGVKQNAGAKKPILHFLIRFPPELLDGEGIGKFVGTKLERQQEMLDQAVDFVNRSHGGDAVFAGRLDRDEAGQTIVDVFAAPKYEKRTKRTKADEPGVIWSSATKYGRELAQKHQTEIRHRHPKAEGDLTGPRMVGIALQTEFAEYFRATNGIPLTAKTQKKTTASDRLEIEAYKEIEAEKDKLAQDRADLAADRTRHRSEVRADRASIEQERQGMTAELMQAAQEVADARRGVEAQEADLKRRAGLLRGAVDVLRRAVEVIGTKLGIKVPPGLTDAIEQIDARARAISAPEDPAPEAERDGFGI